MEVKRPGKTTLPFPPTLSTILGDGEGTHYSHFTDAETTASNGLQAPLGQELCILYL